MIATKDIDAMIGAHAVDPDEDRIGTVGQVYVDADGDRPVWVSVRSGLLGTSETLVPLEGAAWDAGALHVAFAKDLVKDAPRIRPDGELSPEEQQRLFDHYGIAGATTAGSTPGAGFDDPVASDRDRFTAAGGGEGPVGDAGSLGYTARPPAADGHREDTASDGGDRPAR